MSEFLPDTSKELEDDHLPDQTEGSHEFQSTGNEIIDRSQRDIDRVQHDVTETLGLEPDSAEAVAATDEALVHIAKSTIDSGASRAEVLDVVEDAAIEGALEADGLKDGSSAKNPIEVLEIGGYGATLTEVVAELHASHATLPDGQEAADIIARKIDELQVHPDMSGDSSRAVDYVPVDSRGVSEVAPEDLSMGIGINPDTGNFDASLMPRSENEDLNAVHDKIRRGDDLTLKEKLVDGRDKIVTNLGLYELRSDAAYRGISEEELMSHLESGKINGRGVEDEYVEQDNGDNNNKGVDWYLGGTSLRYGDQFVLEVPARPDYFQPAADNGTRLAHGDVARHFKSSGSEKPVPMDMARIIVKDKDSGEYSSFSSSELKQRMAKSKTPVDSGDITEQFNDIVSTLEANGKTPEGETSTLERKVTALQRMEKEEITDAERAVVEAEFNTLIDDTLLQNVGNVGSWGLPDGSIGHGLILEAKDDNGEHIVHVEVMNSSQTGTGEVDLDSMELTRQFREAVGAKEISGPSDTQLYERISIQVGGETGEAWTYFLYGDGAVRRINTPEEVMNSSDLSMVGDFYSIQEELGGSHYQVSSREIDALRQLLQGSDLQPSDDSYRNLIPPGVGLGHPS